MSYLDHIARCNRHDLAQFRPFHIAKDRVGWIRHGLAEQLRSLPGVFLIASDAVHLAQSLTTLEQRSNALAQTAEWLRDQGVIKKLRGEMYPVLARWGTPPLAQIDRGAVAALGISSYGVHVNGFVRKAGGIHMWIGIRARNKSVAPGQYDNLIAGGQPYGLMLMENLVKEAEEEAGLSEEVARRAVPVGAISYCMETEQGLKPDTMFCYDLELDESFQPVNQDGEIESFELWPIAKVAERIRTSMDFKFNVALVILDFLIRHGYLRPEVPDYLEIVRNLRR